MRIVSGSQAALAFGVSIYITFTQAHHAGVGLIALGIYGIGSAVLSVVTAAITGKRIATIESIPGAVVSVLAGILALMLLETGRNLATGFHGLVTAWSLLTAALLVYLANREGFKTPIGRDQLISAVLTALLALIFLVVPLTQIAAVGFFGAYLALIAVHLGIAAASPQGGVPSDGDEPKAD